MEFLAPLMLVGTLAAGLPILIHLIGRRRAPVLRFGAMDFLLGTDRKVARRLRLRDFLLLAVRVAACLAIPLALAKPFVSCAARGPAVERGPQAVALVIDNSFTMGWRQGGEALFARAKARARAILDELGPEADVAIVFTAEGTDAPVELSRDHLRLLDAIRSAPLSHRPADTALALRRAAGLLQGSAHKARRVYLISALAATGFPPGEPPWPPGGGPELHVIDVTGGAPLTNVAVTSVRAEKDPDVGSRGVRVTAEIANYGPAEVKDLGVTLRIGPRAVAKGVVTLGPGEGTAKRFSVSLPADARAADATVEIDADALALDDRRHVRLELRREVRVLVVNGDPRTVRHDDETFYLETALRPGDRADSAMAVTTTTSDEVARRRLADFDVIFLCNVKPLDAARARELEAWVRAGGGLFVAVGDNVDADAYNATMAPLLAQELRSAREVAPGATGRERDSRAEHIGKIEAGHPVFRVFPPDAPALREARFHRYMLVGPTTKVENRRTLARYQNHAPALVEARLGSGRLLLFTSSIDRDWTDLPIHKGFLPLVQEAARYLARTPTRDGATELLVGRTRELPVGPDDVQLEVTAPGGHKVGFDAARLKGRSRVAFSATADPGIYHVTATRAGGVARPRPEADFVVNVDPRGSDVRRVAPNDLPGGGGPAAAAGAGAVPGMRATPKRRVELWHALAAALLLFLASEAVMTRRG